MRNILAVSLTPMLMAGAVFAGDSVAWPADAYLSAGVGSVDITPAEPVILAGSPTRLKSQAVSSRLYVKALVLSTDKQKVAIVTLDTLKYPVDCVERARQKVEQVTGIPAGNVIICASHTHRGPLWSYYKDQLATPIAEAVALAAQDLAPCRFATARGKVDDVSECRRVLKDGQAWNRWQLPPADQNKYPAEGPFDPGFDVLAVIGKDGRYKSIVYNFACHAANTRDLVVSADFPGDTQFPLHLLHLGFMLELHLGNLAFLLELGCICLRLRLELGLLHLSLHLGFLSLWVRLRLLCGGFHLLKLQ